MVQYFERARFEWHPELAVGQKVLLADCGRIYAISYEDLAWLNSALPLNNIPLQINPPLSLRTLAFVARAVTLASDTQRIFIVVQDQTFGPVFGATGSVTVHLSTGENLTYPIVTDINGVGVIPSVNFSDQIPGSLVIFDVSMSYQGLRSETISSFRIWR